jgi:hypothetical protein
MIGIFLNKYTKLLRADFIEAKVASDNTSNGEKMIDIGVRSKIIL